jgi:DNA-binding PadR family transcriptional regulator
MTDSNDFRRKFNKELKTGLLGMLLLNTIARSNEPLYGYGIIKKMEELSGGDLILPEGTVYPILNSLESKGLLKSSWGKGKEGPRRKYYTITKEGRRSLKEILEDWITVSETINNMIGEKEVRS